MPDLEFAARSAFAGVAVSTAAAGEVYVRDRDGVGLATVLVRRGQGAALAARVRQSWGIELPAGPRRAASGGIAFAATGPGAWLASCEGRPNTFATELRAALAGIASVSDQSDGYAPLRLGGPKARDTLLKMVSVDLDPAVFGVGAVASTLAAHIGITLWRLDDDMHGSPVFELVVFRSLAASLWHTLAESASEFGLVVHSPENAAQRVLPAAGSHRANTEVTSA